MHSPTNEEVNYIKAQLPSNASRITSSLQLGVFTTILMGLLIAVFATVTDMNFRLSIIFWAIFGICGFIVLSIGAYLTKPEDMHISELRHSKYSVGNYFYTHLTVHYVEIHDHCEVVQIEKPIFMGIPFTKLMEKDFPVLYIKTASGKDIIMLDTTARVIEKQV